MTAESLLAGLYDGMRLAAVLICVGAANALANPRRLLAALPAALYEVGTALVVALAVFPQLAESLQRVRRARRLRGEPGRGTRGLRSLVVPVLEDALERSLKLAASMDARGYGRSGSATAGQRRLTGTLLVGGLARAVRRQLRLPRLDGPAAARRADAGASVCCSPAPGSWRPVAGSGVRRTGRTRGGCRRCSPPRRASRRRC